MSEQTLAGQVALVTGAAQGIGRAIALELSKLGAKIAICDLAQDPPAVLQELTSEAAYFPCDVSQADAVKDAVNGVVERFGALTILINNAGIAIDGLLLRTKEAHWDKVLGVNLNGVFNCCKAASRHLLKAKDAGRIVNISSVVGERGNAGQISYAASKAGVLGITRTLALEFAGRGVTVNAVAPGFISTQMTDEHVKAEYREQLLASVPLGRIGDPLDVAAAVCYLCSPAAGYVTGQVLRVNGGLYM